MAISVISSGVGVTNGLERNWFMGYETKIQD
jgi:hypothetical protein